MALLGLRCYEGRKNQAPGQGCRTEFEYARGMNEAKGWDMIFWCI